MNFRNSTKNRLTEIPKRKDYYVYAHTLESGEIFYVGKGKWDRAWVSGAKRKNNPEWQKITKNNLWKVVILVDNLFEEEAIKEEKSIIEHFANFGKLVNLMHSGYNKTKRVNYQILERQMNEQATN